MLTTNLQTSTSLSLTMEVVDFPVSLPKSTKSAWDGDGEGGGDSDGEGGGDSDGEGGGDSGGDSGGD
ncbi:hypothetical protein QT970_11260 [Microcoleus sp. herbarium8]|uniref:hypothetical protein n=1 Tax=Microcoleus sp. herbarium8 TaxID=3055436 RepID=UPI002FCEB383